MNTWSAVALHPRGESLSLRDRIRRCVDDRTEERIFRVHRDVFTDPELFDLEQKWIFEATWSFLGLEAQLPNAHDYVATNVGRAPVLVSRGGDGVVRAFSNACRHKGALLTRFESGSARTHVCPYHGWTFNSSGACVHVKHDRSAAYGAEFCSENHDLLPLPNVAIYRGFIFGCLSGDAPPLLDWLGETKRLIDLVVDQSPHGVEFVPGRTVYTYRANWKLQLDNGVDPYHLGEAHSSFLSVQARRRSGLGNTEARSFDWVKRNGLPAGAFNFEYGHSAVWLDQPEPEKRPIFPAIDEIRGRVGDETASWMLKGRNFGLFPNLQIADAISPMLRTFRPLAVNLTEMRAYCLAPVGEQREQRAWRLRQYEDFFNPGGMATPDDSVLYEECQRGMLSHGLGYMQGSSRGMAAMTDTPGVSAAQLDIRPVSSVEGRYDMFSEVAFHAPYREWQRLMLKGFEESSA